MKKYNHIDEVMSEAKNIFATHGEKKLKDFLIYNDIKITHVEEAIQYFKLQIN